MYGLDRFVAPPPLSAIIALLLIIGCDGIGVAVLHLCGLAQSGAPRWQRWPAAVAGGMTLAVILYPLALANLTSLSLMRFAASIVAAIGLVNAVFLIRRAVSRLQRVAARPPARSVRLWVVLVAVMLIGACLMALGPVTDADSLDYHMGVAMAILRSGGMPVSPEWFHSRIAGSNEVLNALGLAAGSEAFGALLQFAGLVAIAGLLLFADQTDQTGAEEGASGRTIAAVAAVSAPVLVGLISQKPQLFPVAMTTFALALVIYPSRRRLTRGAMLRGHALVCLLVMSASQAKLTYMLGGGVVGLLSLGLMARRRLFLPALLISVAVATLLLVPPVAWKHHVFHDGFINSLIRPIPGNWPGTGEFERHLRTFRDSIVPFPLSLVLPSGPTTISTIIGPAGILLLLGLRPERDPWRWAGIAAVSIVLAGSTLLGPPTSRSYLEPYFWLLMVFALQPKIPSRARWLKWPVAAQAILACGLFWFGAMALFPGALTPAWRSRVMDRSANGYRVMKWADSVLPPDAVLMTPQRSIALVPRDAVSLDWTSSLKPNSPDAAPYLQRLKDRRVSQILVFGNPPSLVGFEGCVGSLVAGPGDAVAAYRNPFSIVSHYPAWIFAFNSQLLPECVTAGH